MIPQKFVYYKNVLLKAVDSPCNYSSLKGSLESYHVITLPRKGHWSPVSAKVKEVVGCGNEIDNYSHLKWFLL